MKKIARFIKFGLITSKKKEVGAQACLICPVSFGKGQSRASGTTWPQGSLLLPEQVTWASVHGGEKERMPKTEATVLHNLISDRIQHPFHHMLLAVPANPRRKLERLHRCRPGDRTTAGHLGGSRTPCVHTLKDRVQVTAWSLWSLSKETEERKKNQV